MQEMLQTTVLPLLRYAFAVAEAREGYNCLIGFSFTINYLCWPTSAVERQPQF